MVVATPPLAAAERLRQLARSLENHDGFRDVLAALAAGKPATLDGIWGSACALAAAALAEHCPGTLLVVSPQLQDLDRLADDLELFTSARVHRFPAWETPP